MAVLYLTILCIILFAVLVSLLIHNRRTKKQITKATAIIDEIAAGNLDRRLIVHEDAGIATLCYKINEIVLKMKAEITNHRQSERTYRKLITSLSHDIRTPLASLVGYLNAVEDGLVQNTEKDAYIRLALDRAFDLKDYIDTLFEWLKLESGERSFHFEKMNICEVTREVISHWIPQFEQKKMSYEIAIPEAEIKANLDRSAYSRIINNLMQNILIHSKAGHIKLNIEPRGQGATVQLTDNGIGIPKQDLPYIFDRLYKCDTARRIKGNGLGLSIVHELVKAHSGKISVSSTVSNGTTFSITLP